MALNDLSSYSLLEAWSLGYVSDTRVSSTLPFETFGEIALASALTGFRLGGNVRLRMHLCGGLRLKIRAAMIADGFCQKRISQILGEEHHPRKSIAA